jgi:hypothetical protein
MGKGMNKRGINKAELRRKANDYMAGCLQSVLEAGSIYYYQEENGLTDEEATFFTSVLRNAITQFHKKALEQVK